MPKLKYLCVIYKPPAFAVAVSVVKPSRNQAKSTKSDCVGQLKINAQYRKIARQYCTYRVSMVGAYKVYGLTSEILCMRLFTGQDMGTRAVWHIKYQVPRASVFYVILPECPCLNQYSTRC